MTQSGGRFRFDPDPPIAGQTVTVTYDGPGSKVTWHVDNSTERTVDVPPTTFTLPTLREGTALWVEDDTGDEDAGTSRPITNTHPHP